jgi:Xaa-Pro aminopeptidase
MMSERPRLTRLRQAMAEAGCPAILVSQPESRRYLSGYGAKDLPPRDSAGYLLITDERQLLLTDPRTEEQAAVEAPDFERRIAGPTARMRDVLRDAVVELRLARIGFEANHLPYAMWESFNEALDGVARLEPAPSLIDRIRMVKDPDELAGLKAAIALNDAAFAHLARGLAVGQTEAELAWEMERFVRTNGGEGLAFDPITVGGPNTAVPHAVPSDRPIRDDELVLFDIGSKVRGYCSDMTRTFCVESAPPQLGEVWHVVRDAQLTAKDAVRPGMTGAEVDAIARKLIERAGYGDAFIHGLGHGIGLEVHEPPWITSTRGNDVLTPGMVFTIEPGIYLQGIGGVRIEDIVLLTEGGAEVLSASPKKLQLAEVLRDLDG